MTITAWRLLSGISAISLLAGCVSAQPAMPVPEAALVAPAAQAAPLIAADIAVPGRSVFGGVEVTYTAAVERVSIAPEGDLPPADLVTISYVADDQEGRSARPVLFIFNGGPISASLWLQMGALGPQRVFAPEDLSAPVEDYRLVANPYSPLDAA